MKDKLTRLSSAVDRELREAEARRRYREVEEALRRSERRFRDLVEQAANAIFVLDPEGRIVDANRHACESLGYAREELLAMFVRDIETRPPPGALAKAWDKTRFGAPLTVDAIYRRKDGTTYPVEVRLGVFEEGRLVIAMVRDLTEREEIERRLGEAEPRYRSLVEQRARSRACPLLAQDIHDDALQSLTYALQEIQILQASSGTEGDVRGDWDIALKDVSHALRRCFEGLRSAIFELRLVYTLDRSFMISLRALLE